MKRPAVQGLLSSLIMIPLISLVVFIGKAGAQSETQTTATAMDIRSLLPGIDGWKLTEDPQIYSPETLFEYIDGAAEAYLGYDFQQLLVSTYEKEGTESVVTVEIYDMGSPLNAFGIFSSERYPDIPEVQFGLAGYLEGEVLNFISGPYYIKLLCYNGEEKTADYLKEFAGAVDEKIKDKGSWPALFKMFPTANLIKNSEKYIKKNFMGFDFLANGYAVSYHFDQGQYDAFIIDAKTESEARSSLQKLLDFYAGEKMPFVQEGDRYRQVNRYGQVILISQVRNYLFGLSRVPLVLADQSVQTLNQLKTNLEAAR
ncbi:MAG TPA: hypothetical protein PLB50_04125 [Candidatus Saccharicenans sp.]|nr:hypothetical protein [Candidatus Saccharicenans sp.]HQO75848.1 hypothetical protein [Candidatus Saccharicenans sp.]HUM79719.1 hypothetical protein [Candidatus Saccharicenans sp.]